MAALSCRAVWRKSPFETASRVRSATGLRVCRRAVATCAFGTLAMKPSNLANAGGDLKSSGSSIERDQSRRSCANAQMPSQACRPQALCRST